MIEREDKLWGVRLTLRPLRVNPAMQIEADITNPTPRRNPQKPFVLADALAWREAFDAVLGEAKGVVEELKAKRRKRAKSKPSARPKARRRAKRA
jgi:hypothetical protein